MCYFGASLGSAQYFLPREAKEDDQGGGGGHPPRLPVKIPSAVLLEITEKSLFLRLLCVNRALISVSLSFKHPAATHPLAVPPLRAVRRGGAAPQHGGGRRVGTERGRHGRGAGGLGPLSALRPGAGGRPGRVRLLLPGRRRRDFLHRHPAAPSHPGQPGSARPSPAPPGAVHQGGARPLAAGQGPRRAALPAAPRPPGPRGRAAPPPRHRPQQQGHRRGAAAGRARPRRLPAPGEAAPGAVRGGGSLGEGARSPPPPKAAGVKLPHVKQGSGKWRGHRAVRRQVGTLLS